MFKLGFVKTIRTFLPIQRILSQLSAASVSTSSVGLDVSPSWALIDEKVRITAHGLARCQKVTLYTFLEESNKFYGACGHYIADAHGRVDTYTHESHGGTFEGLEPMGLFWSMTTVPGSKPGRLLKANVMEPYNVNVAVQDGFQEFEKLCWSRDTTDLASCNLQRSYTIPGVKRFPVKENGLHGILFVPSGEGPFPAVIDLFGLTGGILEFRGALLASHGIATFCLAYVVWEDLPKSEKDIDFHYFLEAFDWLASHPLVNPNSLGGISTCAGGGYLQFIASMRPLLKCLVTINSTGAPIGGATQTVEGVHIKLLPVLPERLCFIDGKASLKNMFLPDDDDDVTVCPSWQYNAKHLSIQGLDDKCISTYVMDILRSHVPDEFLDNYTFLYYPGTGHLVEPPYAPLCLTNYNSVFGHNMAWGGQPKLHARAQEESWPLILEFLHNNLSQDEPKSSSIHV